MLLEQVVHQKRILHGVVGQWPEILPYEQHEALKAFFQTRSKPARPPRKWQGSGLYLCGRCNDGQTLMSGTQSHGAGPFYRCPVGLHLGRKAADLDFYVNELVVHRLSRPDAWDLVRKQHQLDVKALRAEREGLEARRNQLARMFATGEIEHAQLKAGTDILTPPQIDALDAQINAAGLRSPLTGILDSGGCTERLRRIVRRSQGCDNRCVDDSHRPALPSRTPEIRTGIHRYCMEVERVRHHHLRPSIQLPNLPEAIRPVAEIQGHDRNLGCIGKGNPELVPLPPHQSCTKNFMCSSNKK